MIYRFDGLELHAAPQELLALGRPVAIAPKALAVLTYLVEHRDRLVTKAELLDHFWGLDVSEAALQTTMSLVRKTLAENGSSAQAIKTYHARGFRFLAQVEEQSPDQQNPPSEQAAASLRLSERRWFAVLSLRLKGLENVAAHADLQAQMDALMDAAQSQVQATRGRLLHMMLDGFSASFGLDPHAEDGTRLALSCAHQIVGLAQVQALAQMGLAVSVGVESGGVMIEAETATPGWRLPGEIERAAAALAHQAAGGAVLLSQTTLNLMRDEIETRATDDGFQLIVPPADRAGLPARPLKRPSLFVGRAAEMAFLTTSLNKARQDGAQTVMLSGPAGIGKSRLVSEFLAGLDGDDLALHQCYCLPRLGETPLALIRAMCVALFEEQLAVPLKDPIDAALMRALLDEAARPDPLLEGLSDHQRLARSTALIAGLLGEICAQKPRVIVFEDIHWIDATSRRYLDALLHRLDQKDLLIVLTTRPTDAAPLAEGILQLAPLGPSESLTLLRAIAELGAVDDTTVRSIAERAAGNPFFLEELALAAQTEGETPRDLPDTVQAVIEVRIAALEDTARMIVYVVSVIGQPATPALIGHLLDMAEDPVVTQLQRLVSMGFLTPSETGFVFRHMLLNDAAYAMLIPAERRKLHAKIATYLEAHAKQDPVRPETLAWHFQEAGQPEQAIGYWTKASYGALFRSAHQEAAVFSNHGLALVDGLAAADPEQEMRLRLSLAQAFMAMKGYGAPDVGTAFRRVIALAQQTQNYKAQAGALVGLWVHTWVRGQLDEAQQYAHGLLQMAKASGNKSLFLQGYGGVGEVLTHTGELSKAMRQLASGLEVVGEGFPDTITGQNAAVTCGAYAAWVSAMLGRLEDMRAYVAQSGALTQLFENRFAEAIHLALCSEAYMFAGDVETCLDLASKAVTLSREHDFPFWLGTGLVMRGWALGEQGDFEAGLGDLEEGIAVFERTGAAIQLPNWYGLKAETLMRAGRLEDAEAAGSFALSHAERTGDLWFAPRIHAVMAMILRLKNDADGARQHAALSEKMVAKEGLAASFVAVADLG